MGYEEQDFEKAKAVVLPVPYDSTTSYNAGARNGPHAMIQASRQVEWYDSELAYSPAMVAHVFTLDELEPAMGSPEETIVRVEAAVTEILEAGKLPIIFGGEHSISLGPIRAVNEFYDNVSVLQIDAHTDLRDSYEGTKYNHASVMRRAREICPVVNVGARAQCKEEVDFLAENGGDVFYARRIYEEGMEALADEIVSKLTENVYISFDLDGLDPSVIPGTGTPEPGGLTWYDALFLLEKVFAKKNVIGFDVTELMPLPGNTVSDFAAAKLAYKMLAYKFLPVD